MVHKFNNVYCATVTPMNDDFSIDFEGHRNNIEWFKKSGIGGIVVCGGTGEFVSLTTDERKRFVEFSAKHNNGKLGFVVGCAAETTAEAIMFAQHAQENGADGLLLISSYYFKPSEEEMKEHFKAVAASVKIPIILYNNPVSCGSNLSPEIVKELSEIDNITHIKDATGDIFNFRRMKELVDDDFNLMVGCDALSYELLHNGARGWISITANALPSQSQMLFNHMMNNELESAWDIYNKFLPLYTLCESPYKAIQSIKYIMDKIGCAGGPSRRPRLELTVDEKKKIDVILKKTGLIEDFNQ